MSRISHPSGPAAWDETPTQIRVLRKVRILQWLGATVAGILLLDGGLLLLGLIAARP